VQRRAVAQHPVETIISAYSGGNPRREHPAAQDDGQVVIIRRLAPVALDRRDIFSVAARGA